MCPCVELLLAKHVITHWRQRVGRRARSSLAAQRTASAGQAQQVHRTKKRALLISTNSVWAADYTVSNFLTSCSKQRINATHTTQGVFRR
eukprot:23181-Pleurochrysis_carterae.AAC.3